MRRKLSLTPVHQTKSWQLGLQPPYASIVTFTTVLTVTDANVDEFSRLGRGGGVSNTFRQRIVFRKVIESQTTEIPRVVA